MSTAAGYVLNVAEHRVEPLLWAFNTYGLAAEAVPEFSHPRLATLVCFAAFRTGWLTHLAAGSLGRRAGTGLTRLNLKNLTELRAPVQFNAILEVVGSSHRNELSKRLAAGGLLPPVALSELVVAIRKVSPEAGSLLDQYWRSQWDELQKLSPHARQALAYQKETVATAMALADRGPNRVEIAVCSIPALLAMKGHALQNRLKQKDAYDVYYCVRNYPGGPETLADACRPLLEHDSASRGYGFIADKFDRADGFGPDRVRRFVQDTNALGDRTAEQWQQDAFGQVDAWLRALGLRN